MTELQFQIRDAEPEDSPFYFMAWLRSYREHSDVARKMDERIYFKWQQKVIERLLRRARLLIAYNPDDSDQHYGFICYESSAFIPILHYIYVKKPFRKLGIAGELLSLMGKQSFVYTHETDIVDQLTHHGTFVPCYLWKD